MDWWTFHEQLLRVPFPASSTSPRFRVVGVDAIPPLTHDQTYDSEEFRSRTESESEVRWRVIPRLMWQVKSMEEALEWVKRCPDPMPGEESEIEIRPVFEAEDFGEEFTPELRAQEERLAAEMKHRKKSWWRRFSSRCASGEAPFSC
jgi:hypothetical protein